MNPKAKSPNPRYRGMTVEEIARAAFKPKHDRVVARPEKTKKGSARQ